jgi:hypothetical protein
MINKMQENTENGETAPYVPSTAPAEYRGKPGQEIKCLPDLSQTYLSSHSGCSAFRVVHGLGINLPGWFPHKTSFCLHRWLLQIKGIWAHYLWSWHRVGTQWRFDYSRELLTGPAPHLPLACFFRISVSTLSLAATTACMQSADLLFSSPPCWDFCESVAFQNLQSLAFLPTCEPTSCCGLSRNTKFVIGCPGLPLCCPFLSLRTFCKPAGAKNVCGES